MRHSSKANFEFKNNYLIISNPKLPQFSTKTALNECEFTLHDWQFPANDPDSYKWEHYGPLIKIQSPKLDIKIGFHASKMKWNNSEGILRTNTPHTLKEKDFFKLIKLLGLEESIYL